MGLRREVNVLQKLVYKDACSVFVHIVRYRVVRYEVSGTMLMCTINLQGVPLMPTLFGERTTWRDTGMYQRANQSSVRTSQ